MVDDRCEVGWPVQLDRVECAVVRLQDTVDALTVRVAGMTVLTITITVQLLLIPLE